MPIVHFIGLTKQDLQDITEVETNQSGFIKGDNNMTIPHIKLTKTMLNKYTIDAKVDILKQFSIEPDQSDGVETWEEPTYRTAEWMFPIVEEVVDIKFYMTARGDKRMSIPKLRKYAEVGDYVWFEIIPIRDSVHHFRINISKKLPLDKKEYEQLQLRFG
jgi:hypothetical protein